MLIYRHKNGEIHQTRGRLQPYAVWRDDKIDGFDSEYLPALKRLAKATGDRDMLASLSSDGLIERVPKEMRHRALSRPVA